LGQIFDAESYPNMATAHVICPNLARPEVLFLSIFVEALFSSKKFCKIDTVALSFVFDKNYPIMD
jgi:hypothetical protein